MHVIDTIIPGVLMIEPQVFGDSRGFFMESFHARTYAELGVTGTFVQDNVSLSRRGVLRGLHFQHPNSQGKLVYVLQGEIFDVVVDIRRGSPTFGQWSGVYLSAENKRQVWIPKGFAHGFCVISESALFAYKCTDYYHPEHEGSVLWSDPSIGIEWPIDDPQLSTKDAKAPTLHALPAERLPRVEV